MHPELPQVPTCMPSSCISNTPTSSVDPYRFLMQRTCREGQPKVWVAWTGVEGDVNG